MVKKLFKKVFGSRNRRVINKLLKIVGQINAIEPSLQALDNEGLRAKTQEFRDRYQQGETLDQLLVEAFAVVREASKRTLGLRHFDVQLLGGIILHQGKIAEMRTGEGKTLTGTLPVYLNAITQKSVHLVTVNDYLAKRDAAWMEPIYNFLGLTVGVNLTGMSAVEKRHAYGCDITCGTNNEFGFDYLRDNMALSADERVQRDLGFVIIDEVDSILIDEARTPLIISGPSEDNSDICVKINDIIPLLTKREQEEGPGDYYLEEKNKQAFLTETGHEHVEALLVGKGLLAKDDNLYAPQNILLNNYLNAALRAHTLYHNNVDYIIRDGKVVIVDEHTGRTMPGRRWSDGLHQAIEAKEGVAIQQENQTLASITFQNYFRLYDKLSGMTGTADTEAYEFQQIYSLEVVVIPTNRTMIRQDQTDKIFLTAEGKFKAIIAEIEQCYTASQPVLVGTAAIETSEYLSKLLKKAGIPHQVLNAKFHDKEAKIIAEAGRPKAVTIATNMAGRGTDIVLGGNLEMEIAALGDDATEFDKERIRADWQKNHQTVLEAGGLIVIGSERHESRRIDNQLRGRSGRQGDPGRSRFYLSLDDNLMRIFASPRVAGLMQKLGMKETEAIEHVWVNKAIENAQRKVEGFHFDIRKQLLEYDDVANEQRQVIYQQRNQLLTSQNLTDEIDSWRDHVVEQLICNYIAKDSVEEQWDIQGLEACLQKDFDLSIDLVKRLENDSNLGFEAIYALISDNILTSYQAKFAEMDVALRQQLEKTIMLQTLDNHWRDHLNAMDHLRQGIHLRGYAQKNPKQEYKREAFNLFMTMLDAIKYEVICQLTVIKIQQGEQVMEMGAKERQALLANSHYQHAEFNPRDMVDSDHMGDNVIALHEGESEAKPLQPYIRSAPKLGRNDPCFCGSGKKYKHCHGKLNSD